LRTSRPAASIADSAVKPAGSWVRVISSLAVRASAVVWTPTTPACCVVVDRISWPKPARTVSVSGAPSARRSALVIAASALADIVPPSALR
jgi:hypothetical protein